MNDPDKLRFFSQGDILATVRVNFAQIVVCNSIMYVLSAGHEFVALECLIMATCAQGHKRKVVPFSFNFVSIRIVDGLSNG